MSTIGDLKVRLGLESTNFTSGIKQAKVDAAGLGNVLGTAGRQASAFGGILSTAIGTAGGFVIAQGIMRGVGAAFGFAKDAAIGYNSILQQSEIGFTSMLHSAEQAQAMLQQLKQFANTSPFELPDVLVGSQRLLAMGFAAAEVIPMLTDVGNVSAAMGKGKAGIDQMTLALGQMNASVVLHTQDLNQMVAVGVPVWDLLSQATGKSTGEVKKMVEQGQIASDVFIKAFHDWSQANFGDMMEKQSHTFQGAMSNIVDNLRGGIAQGVKPFFDALSQLADKIGQFVSSDRFAGWVAQVQILSERAVGAIRDIAKSFQNDTISEAIRQLLNRFNNLASSMFGAGWNLIETYASGIAAAANSVLRGIINAISSMIASFFIGNSPPPEGPLSEIDQGGQTLMQTYGEGMSKGLAPVRDAAGAVADLFSRLDQSLTLDQARAAMQSAAGNLDAMEAAGEAVDDQIRQIDHAADELDRTISGLRREIEDTTDAYDAQIKPLQDQVDALTQARDLERERRDLNLRLQDIQLKEAELAAEGDPQKRAELAAQIAVLKAQEQQHDLQQQILDTQKQIAEAPLKAQQDALKAKEDEQKLAQRQAEIDAARAKATTTDAQAALKLKQDQLALDQRASKIASDRAAGKDVSDAQAKLALDRQAYQLKLQAASTEGPDTLAAKQAQLEIDKQQFALKQQSAALDTGPDVEGLNLKLAELQAQQQLAGLTDQTKTGELAKQRALLDAQSQQNDLAEQELDTKNKIAALPLEQQIAGLKQQQADALKPLNEQLKVYERQADLLGEQRKQWQNLKADISDAVQPLKQAEADAKAAAKTKAGEGPTIGLAPGETRLPTKPIELINQEDIDKKKKEIEDKGRDIGQKIGDGIRSYLSDNLGGIIGGALGAVVGGAAFGPVGAVVGGLIGRIIGNGVQKELAKRGIDFTPLRRSLQSWLALISLDVKSHDWSALFNVIVLAIGALATNVGSALEKVGERFLGWIGPRIGPMLVQLQGLLGSVASWLATEGLATLLTHLGRWGQALVEWIAPQIPPLLKALGDLLVQIGQWALTTFLPFWKEKIGEWGRALIAWVEPQIPPLLSSLGNLLSQLGAWITGTALPAIGTAMADVGRSIAAPVIGAFDDLKAGVMSKLGELSAWLRGIWDQVRTPVEVLAAMITGLLLPAFVQMAVSAVTNGAIAATAWISTQVAALASLTVQTVTAIPGIIAGWASMALESTVNAGKVVASWVATSAAAIAETVTSAAQFGVMVAKWVWLGIQSLLNAAKVAAAWVIAAGPIAWVSAAVAGLAVLIITHWGEITSATEQLKDAVVGFFGDLWDGVTEKVSSLWSWLKEHWQEIVTGILAIVFPPGAGLFLLITHFGEIRDKIGEIVDSVKSAVSNGFGSLKDTVTGAFSDAKDWLVDAGAHIVEGLWNGIKSLAGWLKDKVTGFIADNIPAPVQKLLGITSPSKVMAGFGRNIAQGLAVGIEQERNAPRAAMLRVSRDVLSAATITAPRVMRPLGVGSGPGGAANGQPVIIHNYLFPNSEKLNTTIYNAEAQRAARTF